MKKGNKIFGFQSGKHIVDIKAEDEHKAFIIYAKNFFPFIDTNSGVSLLGERTTTAVKKTNA